MALIVDRPMASCPWLGKSVYRWIDSWAVGFGSQTCGRPTVFLLRSRMMKYRVLLEQDEDGAFVATCPALPGCISQGTTRTEATVNIREAIEGYLKSLRKHGDPVPPSISEEVIEVSG